MQVSKKTQSSPPLRTDFTVPGKHEHYTVLPGEAAALKVMERNGTPQTLIDQFQGVRWLGALEQPDGRQLASPLLAEASIDAVYGTVDLDQAKGWSADTGFVPIELQGQDGKNRAVVGLLSIDYQKNSLNLPYHEAAMLLYVSPESAPITVPETNGYSPVAAAGAPGARALNLGLGVDKQEPIDWGVETIGLPKRPGSITYTGDEAAGRNIDVADECHRPVISIRNLKLSQQDQLAEADQMAAAFGIPVEALANLPTEVITRMVHRDVNNGDMVASAFATRQSLSSVFNLAEGHGEVQIGDTATREGEMLTEALFKPSAFWHDPNALFAYGEEASILPPAPEEK
jgi:hypothetical protein